MKEYIFSIIILSFSLLVAYLISFETILFFNYKLVYVLWLLIFTIHISVFIPSYIYQTEHYYDLTGGITFISSVVLLTTGRYLYFGTIDYASLIVSLLVSLWTIRLSSFLFLRVKRAGQDIRFSEIKKDFKRFLLAFILSGLWVFTCLLPSIVVLTSSKSVELDIITISGIIIWVFGFIFEVVADKQKTEFNKKNKGRFISTGLWSLTRHPNYFGEITLWVGMAVISLSSLSGIEYVTAVVSPLFIYLLLRKAEGVPMLERIADERYGELSDYQEYKANTPVLMMKIFK